MRLLSRAEFPDTENWVWKGLEVRFAEQHARAILRPAPVRAFKAVWRFLSALFWTM